MTDHILATKLYIPPSRPNLLPRVRLWTYLDEVLALGRKVTLVSAPAGFGKTTLISEWVHYRAETFPPCRCAWVTLDSGENHLAHFLAYLVAAIQKIDATLGEELQHVRRLPESPPMEAVLTELLNGVAARAGDDPHAHYLLVLDDYQTITEPDVHRAVTFLLEQLPHNWHLVLTTRSDPALPLARLRARGHLTEIRAADLRFTSEESATYLHQSTGVAYTQSDLDALTARTEGWIAGLQLFSLLLQESIRRQSTTATPQIIRNFTGTHRYVIDYLTDEVLDQQPATRRDFLLRTSILTRLTAPLCDALIPAAQPSQTILTTLEADNLFLTPLDEQRQWYRYHHLFADLLQTRLQEQVGMAEVAALHLRACFWFEQQGFIAEALHHALAAADLDRAKTLIATHAMPAIRRGAISAVHEWLQALPTAQVRAHPRLCIAQAWVLFHAHKADAIEPWIEAAAAALQQPPFTDTSDRATLIEHLSALRISVAELRQEHETVVRLAQAALARIGETEHSARGTNLYFLGRALGNLGETERGVAACLAAIPHFQAAGVTLAAMGATSDVALFLLQQGKLRTAQTTLEEALRWAAAQELLTLPATAQLQMVLGQISYEQNELRAAAAHLQHSIQLAKYMLPLIASLAYLGYAQLQLALGNQAGATDALQEAEQVVAHLTVVPPESTLLLTRRVRIWLQQENFAAVAQWVEHTGLQADAEPTYSNEQELVTLARLLVTRGRATGTAADLHQATTLLARLAEALGHTERMGHLLEVWILQALAFEAQGQTKEALAPLTKALQWAEREGYLRIFCDEGPPMQRLLGHWQEENSAQSLTDSRSLTVYVNRIQQAFATGAPTTTTTDAPEQLPTNLKASTAHVPPRQPSAHLQPPHEQLPEPLTSREHEVLHLMAAGLDNMEIADELTIAVSTVKTHVNHIFAKLEVHSRTQAVARARGLQLIP